MKKSLSEVQFQKCIKGLDVGKQTLEIAYGILVEGKQQSVFMSQFGLTSGAVSQAVNRVWKAHNTRVIPEGFTIVSEVLPNYQAYIVKKWAETAKKNRGKQ